VSKKLNPLLVTKTKLLNH